MGKGAYLCLIENAKKLSMKTFYKAAATMLIEHQITFTYKVNEMGSIQSSYLTCKLFDITTGYRDEKTVWVESGGKWMGFFDKKSFTNYLKEIINEQAQQK